VLQFVCDVVKDMGEEEYVRPFIHYPGLDWMCEVIAICLHAAICAIRLKLLFRVNAHAYL